MNGTPSGATLVAGVAGAPVAHSLSPTLHNAWIAASGLDAVYVAFTPPSDHFTVFAEGLRGGAVRGVNVTAPFKEAALRLADRASERALASGAANLLIFERDGQIVADNTDGVGLLTAFAAQAPAFDPAAGVIVVIGAGGAARGAATALLAAGAPSIEIINRSAERGEALASLLGARCRFRSVSDAATALVDASVIVNATPAGLLDEQTLDLPLEAAPRSAVVMDMVYRPLRTALLRHAEALGLVTVDGLAMLIGQAAPSFEALFGQPPPQIDVRALAIAAMERFL